MVPVTGGTPKRLGPGSGVVASPKGQRVAWVSRGQIWSADLATADGHAVEAAVREGQALGVRDHEGDLRADALIDQAIAPALEHLSVDVGQDGEPVAPDLPREAGAKVAGAGGDIECMLSWPEPGLGERKPLPQPVHAAGHEVVHQVVAAGNGIEHAADARGLFLGSHPLIAEVDGLHGRPILRVRPRRVRTS